MSKQIPYDTFIETYSKFSRLSQFNFKHYMVAKRATVDQQGGIKTRDSRVYEAESQVDKYEYELVHLKKILLAAVTYKNIEAFVSAIVAKQLKGLSLGSVKILSYFYEIEFNTGKVGQAKTDNFDTVNREYEKEIQSEKRQMYRSIYEDITQNLQQMKDFKIHKVGSFLRDDLYLRDLDFVLECEEKDVKQCFYKVANYFVGLSKEAQKQLKHHIKNRKTVNDDEEKKKLNKEEINEKNIKITIYDKFMKIWFEQGGHKFKIDIWHSGKRELQSSLFQFTGPKYLIIAVNGLYKTLDLKLNRYGITKDNKTVSVNNQQEIFENIGLKYIEPELR